MGNLLEAQTSRSPDERTERSLTPPTVPEAPRAAQRGPAGQVPTPHPVPPPPTSRVRRLLRGNRLLPLASALLLTGLLLLLLTDAGQAPGRRVGALPGQTAVVPPTATMLPTVTPTVVLSPTPMPGFKLYYSRSTGFMMDYPQDWTLTSAGRGPEFTNDPNSPGYIVQVFLPSASAGPGLGPNDAAAWVDYAMTAVVPQSSTTHFSRVPGPPSTSTIGGVAWQTGVGILTDDATKVKVRVQIYATVYNGKPYIISLVTADDRFSAGTIEFFAPMLQSFQFLPPSD